ncbi:carbon-nitrogen hydrolase [Athelia psychrophila]|uniref:Carbon-nitrogen hydrolase n=1 Tax=Athelia psychrophila TaxID=1759441 RepID=A0A166E1H1_9AGAM|nr:carbon-nitrogen hydrolase [Fibularhizoctonia sp. CBS 109695]
MAPTLRAAACHASPHFLSAALTTQKAIALIRTAAANAAHLIVFPETYIPAFPVWSSVRPPTQNHELFARMAAESVYADGPEVRALRDAARELGVMVSVGISEKVRYSVAALFNSNIIIGKDGEVLVHHRKLMPTFYEKLTWSPGDGHGLRVAELEVGRGGDGGEGGTVKIGALICGENTNPLARYALMAEGEQVHISCWPAIWPTREAQAFEEVAGADKAAGGKVKTGSNYDNVGATRIRIAAHCFEAKCFGIICSAVLPQEAVDLIVSSSGSPESTKAIVRNTLEQSSPGATMFIDPMGALLPGFTIDADGNKQARDMLQKEEGILYADLDMERCVEGKQYHDVVAGYQRLDVFDLKVDRRRREPATFLE